MPILNCTLGRNDLFPLENFKRGVKVWIRDSDKVWTCGELLHDLTFAGNEAKIQVTDEDVVLYDIVENGLPFLRNPDILLGSDDLTCLSYLHEPAVLNNLRHRFVERQAIYTYCGIVLVAINPYADCTHLYADEVIQVYHCERDDVRKSDPHIYAIAAEAYVDLCKYGKNQSVIISGESGAGKTVSAKFVMRYLTSVASSAYSLYANGSANDCCVQNDKIENRVLASNPIMESIGNAKTIRNDNSSRFGKFIQMNFVASRKNRGKHNINIANLSDLQLSGAEMKTYLLEKSRVVFRSADERNYHIFYQMCAAATVARAESQKELHQSCVLDDLQLMSASEFAYLRDSTECNSDKAIQIEGVDDAKEFVALLAAFETLKIYSEEQRDIFSILAGILFIGNVCFVADGRGEAHIKSSDERFVNHLCERLFNVDRNELVRWLTTREIRAGGDVVFKALSVKEAVANRDALAKAIYACLFDWIVQRINGNLSENSVKNSSNYGDESGKFIGVLDIYGFEMFERNSFEQFCINYANEKLQQQFNQHVFKLEQAEYKRENISWDQIDFEDNQRCINLIEDRPGIIDYLDEQCKTGRGTDATWLDRMRNCQALKQYDYLRMPKIRDASFVIRHFASEVLYQVEGFIEKNMDTVNEQLLNTVGETKSNFLRDVMKGLLASSTDVKRPPSGGSQLSSSSLGRRKRTVAVQFRESLNELISVLSATRPHYVRCIKPNDYQRAFYFDARRTIQQLRANGVLETVRISAAGFPSRWTYKEFEDRFRILLPFQKRREKPKSAQFARLICEKYLETDKFALGETKVFLRTGQLAYIERLRNETIHTAATIIQATIRGWLVRRKYLRIRRAVLCIQAYGKAYMMFRRVKYLQMHCAAICIQNAFYHFLRKRRCEKLRSAILCIQTHFRGHVARQQFLQMKYLKSAIIIQKTWRGYLVRRKQVENQRRIVKVQCCVRRFLARCEFKRLKAEARRVSHWQNLNKGLENKIITLQRKLDLVTSERNGLLCQDEALRKELEVARARLLEFRRLNVQLQELSGILRETRENFTLQTTQIDKAFEDMRLNIVASKVHVDDLTTDSCLKADKILQLTHDFSEKMKECDQLNQKYVSEAFKTKFLEKELEATRAQLLENVELLSSSNFSRVGSFRSDYQQNMSSLTDIGGISASGTSEATGSNANYAQLLAEQQHVINDLRKRLDKKERMVSHLKLTAGTSILNKATDQISSNTIYESMKIQDLELKISKYKSELQKMSEKENIKQDFMALLEKSWEENDRLLEENRHIRAILAKMFERQTSAPSLDSQSSVTNNSQSRQRQVAICSSPTSVADSGFATSSIAGTYDDDFIGQNWGSNATTDQEMEERIDLERYVRHYRLLLDIASREVAERDDRILYLESQLSLLHNDAETSITNETDLRNNLEHSNVVGSNGVSATVSPFNQSTIESIVQENLSLQRKYDRNSDELAEARAYLRGYSTVIDSASASAECGGDNDNDDGHVDCIGGVQRLHVLKQEGASKHSALLEIFNVPEFTRILIYDMRPQIAKRLYPCLPSYLLLMAFRYYDQRSDDVGLTNLFNAVHALLRENSMTSTDTDVLALWLANSWRLLNLLRQYSRSETKTAEAEEWTQRNTPTQQSHAICHFNLEPLRNQLKMRVQVFYNNFMKRTVEPLLTPKIVPAILQHESYEFRHNYPSASVNANDNEPADLPRDRRSALDDLIEFLNFVYVRLRTYGADAIIIAQTFRQIVQWIVALALNHMMFRRDLCTPDKAISIKHNIMQIQHCLEEKRMGADTEKITSIFEPLIQASHLLQLRKCAANLDVLCGEMTSRLKPKQILAILRHFTPSADCRFVEEVIDEHFLAMMAEKLAQRVVAETSPASVAADDFNSEKDELLMRGTYLEPFDTRPFVYSEVVLETLALPASLNFQSVSRLI